MNDPLLKTKAPRKKGRGVKLALAAAGTLSLLCAFGAYTQEQNRIIPQVVISTTPQPTPNARMFFLAAAEAIQDAKAVDTAATDIAGAKNGVPASSGNHASADAPPADTLAAKARIVRENQKTLATLRRGLAYAYGNPPARSASFSFAEFAKFRSIARLLILEAQVKRAKGDWNGAVSAELDCLEMGVMMPQGGVLIADLTGIACEAIGRRSLWDDIPHLNAAQSLAALRRLEKIEAKRFPYADVIEEEKRLGQASLLETWGRADKEGGSPSNFYLAEKEDWNFLQKLHWRMREKWTSRQTVMDRYTRYMDGIIANCRRPYGLHLPPPAIPDDPMNQMMGGITNEARLKAVVSETEVRLLAVSLALSVYRQKRGEYPPSLDALRGIIAANLCLDLFAAQGDLRYRRDGAKTVLYSVGPDGRDDGGRPIYDTKQSEFTRSGARARYFVASSSLGDVVAGLNR